MKKPNWIRRGLVTAILLCMHAYTFAGPIYTFTKARWGDEVVPVDINDHGAIVYNGFPNNGQGGGQSYVDYAPGDAMYANGSYFVMGYGNKGADGVHVTAINDAGDLFGTAVRTDGVTVKTIWLKGVPYDLTDPEYAGLVFSYDPGPQSVGGFDLLALDVVNLPSDFIPPDLSPCDPPFDHGYGECKGEPHFRSSTTALTNARGDFVFAFGVYPAGQRGGLDASYGILTRGVPEPSTLTLALLGLIAPLACAGRRKPLLVCLRNTRTTG